MQSSKLIEMPTVSGVSFQIGDCVLVKYDDSDDQENHADLGEWPEENTWPARILKVVGGDEAHVYVLMNFFFRPEDLEPNTVKGAAPGRHPYHARREVIASNWLEVHDASEDSVDDPAMCI